MTRTLVKHRQRNRIMNLSYSKNDTIKLPSLKTYFFPKSVKKKTLLRNIMKNNKKITNARADFIISGIKKNLCLNKDVKPLIIKKEDICMKTLNPMRNTRFEFKGLHQLQQNKDRKSVV